MQEQSWTPGEDLFLESFSPENAYGVIFEDDGEAAYFYAVEKEPAAADGSGDAAAGSPADPGGGGIRILDALHIHETEDETSGMGDHERPLMIIWSKDWLKCALVIDGYCHALFDFVAQGGYNINEFPPPNEFWTKGDRKLTEERIREHF